MSSACLGHNCTERPASNHSDSCAMGRFIALQYLDVEHGDRRRGYTSLRVVSYTSAQELKVVQFWHSSPLRLRLSLMDGRLFVALI